MSKNMKFLRNAALVVAVLAMVFGQCFGMLGGVAARAAAATAGDLTVDSITWKTSPASQLIVQKETSATVTVTVKATKDVDKAEIAINSLLDVYGADSATEAFATTGKAIVTKLTGTDKVEIPALTKDQTYTFDVTVKAAAGDSEKETAAMIVVAPNGYTVANCTYGAIPGGAAKTTIKTIKVIADVSKPDQDSTTNAATGLVAMVYNPTTGASTSSASATLGDTALEGVKVRLMAGDKLAHNDIASTFSTVTWENITTGAKGALTTPLASSPEFDFKPAVNTAKVGDKPAFQAGLNVVKISATAGATTFTAQILVNVALAKPVVKLAGVATDASATSDLTSFADVQADQVRVKLTATMTNVASVYTFPPTYDAAKPQGTIVFKDNGTVIGQVVLGTAVDNIPITTAHKTAYTNTIGNVAVFGYVAQKGAHKYTAEYIPAGDAAKALTATTPDAQSTLKEVSFVKPVANVATLSFDPVSSIAGAPVKVTLSFDSAPGAGSATLKFLNGGVVENTARFTLNATDKTYSTTVLFPTKGTYTVVAADGKAADKVTFEFAADTYLMTTTGKINKNTPTAVAVAFGKVNGVEVKSIDIAQYATTTTLTLDKTTAKLGETVKLTASVLAGNTAVTAGEVQFYEMVGDKPYSVGSPVKINATSKTATLDYVANNAAVNGIKAVFTPINKPDYTSSESTPVALTVETTKGALKLEGPTAAIDATGKAKFTVSILNASGAVDTASYFGQVTSALVDVTSATTIPSSVYIYAGTATFEIDVTPFAAGTHELTVTVVDTNYGTMKASVKFVVSEPSSLLGTALEVTEPVAVASPAFGSAFLNGNYVVTIKDAGKTGGLTDATGKVTLYLGDVEIASTTEISAEGVATFLAKDVKAMKAGKDQVITAKYSGNKKYAASEVTGEKKYTIPQVNSVMSVTADGSELTILLNVPANYTPNGKIEVKVGDLVVATIAKVEAKNVINVASPALVGEQDVTVAFTGDNGMTDASKTLKVTFPASSGWVEAAAGVWNYYKDGEMVKGEWLKAGSWFYMNDQGVMLKGWQKLQWNGKSEWFYFKPASPNSGAMLTGWQQIGGKWYFMNGSGIMQTGWIKVGSYWYYMNTSGAMLTGWQQIGGNWYYLDANGRMATSGTIDGWNIAPNGIATKA